METKEIREDLISTFLQRFPKEAAEVLNSTLEYEIIDYLQDQPLNIGKAFGFSGKFNFPIKSTPIFDPLKKW